MNHVLCGLAANVALSSELVNRLIAVADADIAVDLADRADPSHTQAVALVSRVEEIGVQLAHEGLLTAADVDPAAQPHIALALLHERAGSPEWARLLPADVVEALAADPDVRVVAELALWTARPRSRRRPP